MDMRRSMEPIYFMPERLAGGGLRLRKDSPDPPAPPAPIDPSIQINAEAAANRYNIRSPFGTQTWEGPNSGANTLTTTLTPSQQRQFNQRNQIAETLMGRAQEQIPNIPSEPFNFAALRDAPQTGGTFTPTVNGAKSGNFIDTLAAGRAREQAQPFNANIDGTAVRDAAYRKATGLLDPHFDREEERLEQKLANQGLPMGGEAFKRDFGDFSTARDSSYERAAQDAVAAGAAEEQAQFSRAIGTRQQNVGETQNADTQNLQRQIAALTGSMSADQQQFGRDLSTRQQNTGETDADYQRYLQTQNTENSNSLQERQQNYNELAALLGGQQLNPVAAQAQPLDVAGAYNRSQAGANAQYQGQLAGYNADVASNNSQMSGMMGLGAAALTFF